MAGATGGATGAAMAMAIQATKASGAIVRVKTNDFEQLLARHPEPLVVEREPSGLFQRKYQYLTNYKGFFFYTDTDRPISLPPNTEHIKADTIWIPG